MNNTVSHELAQAGPPTLVAVYGTLKCGFANHHLLQQAQFLGGDCLTDITLYDLGPYPGAKALISDGIDVEVYVVTPAQLAALDILEEYNTLAPELGMYTRVQFATRFGMAWVYLYNLSVNGMAAQCRGGWMPAPVPSGTLSSLAATGSASADLTGTRPAGTGFAGSGLATAGYSTEYLASDSLTTHGRTNYGVTSDGLTSDGLTVKSLASEVNSGDKH